MQIIINPQGKKIAIQPGVSAGHLAKMLAFSGKIGKTSLSELITGKRTEAKGFRVANIEKPLIANKLGVESVGTGKLRTRKSMKIYVKPLATRGLNARNEQTDFGDFLKSVYAGAKANNGQVEYNQLAASLGWSRNYIAIYAARARKLGFVDVVRESNCVWKKGI